jgi:hypothetical protein
MDRSERWYTLYGRPVRSDVRLPVGTSARPPLTQPGWTFERRSSRRGAPPPDGPPVATLHDPSGAAIALRHQASDGIWIRHPGIGACHIAPRKRKVDVYARPGVDEVVLGQVLTSQISVMLLHELGHVTLRASAVARLEGAIAFLGAEGQGKSTLADWFVQDGAELVTDDALALQADERGALALPGLPRPGGDQPVRGEPAPLRGIFLLDRRDAAEGGRVDVTLQRLTGREGLTALLGHAACAALLPPGEVARLLPRYARVAAQVPIRVLSYPSGLEHREAVRAAVLAELAGP